MPRSVSPHSCCPVGAAREDPRRYRRRQKGRARDRRQRDRPIRPGAGSQTVLVEDQPAAHRAPQRDRGGYERPRVQDRHL
eukprot:15439830-Alexandrium_andersonii.AAC.1